MCRSNFYETGIYSCQLEVKNTFKLSLLKFFLISLVANTCLCYNDINI